MKHIWKIIGFRGFYNHFILQSSAQSWYGNYKMSLLGTDASNLKQWGIEKQIG